MPAPQIDSYQKDLIATVKILAIPWTIDVAWSTAFCGKWSSTGRGTSSATWSPACSTRRSRA